MDKNETQTQPTPPSKPFPDFNGNGVADYQEGWFWKGVWAGFSGLVRTFAKPHTLVYRAVEAAEAKRAELIAAGA